MSTSQEKQLEMRIARIKRDLSELGAMRPGSISRQYRDPKEKRRPFWQISYTHRMKSRSEYVRPENLAALRRETAAYRRFRLLVERWADASLKLSRLRADRTRTTGREKRKKETAG